jgi:hypothetical protein
MGELIGLVVVGSIRLSFFGVKKSDTLSLFCSSALSAALLFVLLCTCLLGDSP